MDYKKFKAQIAHLKNFADKVDEICDAFALLSISGLNDFDLKFLDDMEKIVTLSVAPLAGKDAEFDAYYKHRYEKRRNVVFQGGFADVTVDYGNGFGKAVQHKSSFADDCASITNFIGDAANQLSGERHENPRPNDRWIIDMIIRSPNNPWPFSRKDEYGTHTLLEYKERAKAQIHKALSNYVQGDKGLSPNAVGRLTNTMGLATQKIGGVKSTWMGTTNPNIVNSPLSFMRSISVKIRYDIPYPLTNQPAKQQYLEKVVFEATMNGNNLTILENSITLI